MAKMNERMNKIRMVMEKRHRQNPANSNKSLKFHQIIRCFLAAIRIEQIV